MDFTLSQLLSIIDLNTRIRLYRRSISQTFYEGDLRSMPYNAWRGKGGFEVLELFMDEGTLQITV